MLILSIVLLLSFNLTNFTLQKSILSWSPQVPKIGLKLCTLEWIRRRDLCIQQQILRVMRVNLLLGHNSFHGRRGTTSEWIRRRDVCIQQQMFRVTLLLGHNSFHGWGETGWSLRWQTTQRGSGVEAGDLQHVESMDQHHTPGGGSCHCLAGDADAAGGDNADLVWVRWYKSSSSMWETVLLHSCLTGAVGAAGSAAAVWVCQQYTSGCQCKSSNRGIARWNERDRPIRSRVTVCCQE